MTVVALRPAGIADLGPVVEVFLGCWRSSYAGRLPEALVASMTDEVAHGLWATALSTPGRQVALAEADEHVRGVVGFEASGDDGWVHSLYVSPSAQGRGVGSTLLSHASDRLQEAGCHRAYLWVFADNTTSIAFYARHGWTPDGAERVEEAFGENEIRLARSWTVST